MFHIPPLQIQNLGTDLASYWPRESGARATLKPGCTARVRVICHCDVSSFVVHVISLQVPTPLMSRLTIRKRRSDEGGGGGDVRWGVAWGWDGEWGGGGGLDGSSSRATLCARSMID